MLLAASRFAMWLSAASGIFLAFGWPFLPGADPSSETFHVLAVGTLVALLGSIVAALVARR